jgi:hypothetical protein
VKRLALLGLWGLVLAPAGAQALDFTADRTVRTARHVEHTRIFYRDDMWRVEHNAMGPVQVTIVRKDQQLVWHLLPVTKQFKTVTFEPQYRMMVRPALDGELSREVIGTQMLDGHPTTLYEISVRTPQSTVERYYQWVATDLNFPLKLVKKDGDWTMEYHHVKMSRTPDYFFQLPRAYSPLEETHRE